MEEYTEYVEEEIGETNGGGVGEQEEYHTGDESRYQDGDYKMNTKIFDMKNLPNSSLAIPVEKRTTTRFMTKYERARLLGTRALQLR